MDCSAWSIEALRERLRSAALSDFGSKEALCARWEHYIREKAASFDLMNGNQYIVDNCRLDTQGNPLDPRTGLPIEKSRLITYVSHRQRFCYDIDMLVQGMTDPYSMLLDPRGNAFPPEVEEKIYARFNETASLDDRLIYAVKIKDDELVWKLLDAGADPNTCAVTRDGRYIPILMLAIMNPMLKGASGEYLSVPNDQPRNDIIVMQLIAYGADVNVKRDAPKTPVIWAVDNDDRDLLWTLLKADADVHRDLPLDRAIQRYKKNYCKSLDITRALLVHGADPYYDNKRGIREAGVKPELLNLLQSFVSPNTKLLEAVQNGNLKEVQRLIDNSANEPVDVNYVSPSGESVLVWSFVHPRILSLLLKAGAHLNVPVPIDTGEMMTPLAFAATRGYVQAVELLLYNGAVPSKELISAVEKVASEHPERRFDYDIILGTLQTYLEKYSEKYPETGANRGSSFRKATRTGSAPRLTIGSRRHS